MFDLAAVQSALKEFGFDGWLLYDFRGSNVLAQRVMRLKPEQVGSRRYFYFIPAQGEPHKLVHRIETSALDHLPGGKTIYLKWQELEAGIKAMVSQCKKLAMEYSPRNANPYISRVDAGTVELVKSFGPDVLPSGDLIQLFEATLTPAQQKLHFDAAVHTNAAYDRAWKFIADQVKGACQVDELAVRQEIMQHFAEHGMETYHPPIVAVGPNSGLPHYETGAGENTTIRQGDFVLIDLWAKLSHPDGIYSDLTRVGYVGETIPETYSKVFEIVASARNAAIDRVRTAMAKGEKLQGWQVDQAARDVIEKAGYGQAFVHRTGHSIGRETHGNGANMDNLETHEDRQVMRNTCFSIEPGIYLPEEGLGVRSEIDVFLADDGPRVFSKIQRELVRIQ
jgi:Xaa-Pro dipeptidase